MRKDSCAMRCLLALILMVAGIDSIHAQLLRSLEPLVRVQTEAFEIYAPSRLEAQAVRLSTFADQTYAMLCDFFGTSPTKWHIPVLVTDYQYSLNGFSTLYPSNRIVILLASADPRSQLATLGDELRSVFLHELVHYVTLNERTVFWKAASWLGGDWVAPEVWMMPQAMVEGTAVWAESRLDGQEEGIYSLNSKEKRHSGGGRLNDPAALEMVRLDRAKRISRDLWDVSGLRDFYGSGSLPYLYGGLFADYLSFRFGPEIIGELWSASASGTIFRGFDGTLTSSGILERKTGESVETLWKNFLEWIDASQEGSADDGSVELFEGFVGAMGAGERSIYYVDLERRGVYALKVGEGGERKRLFAADGTLRNIFFNVKFSRLDLDWIRTTPNNQQIPAQYHYSFDTKTLQYDLDLPIPETDNVQSESANNPAKGFFIYDSWQDPETHVLYGLGRCGSTILPARKFPDGSVEVVDMGNFALRWMSPGFRSQSDTTADSIRFAFQVVPLNGLSRLALLDEEGGAWRLYVEKRAPPWGVSQPILFDDHHVVYRGSNPDGRTSLRIFDLGALDATETSAVWVPLSTWLAGHLSTALFNVSEQSKSKTSSALFPLAFATSRFPYANGSLVGIDIFANDITERLFWSLFGGWDWSIQRPTAAASLQLATGAWQLGISASDQAVSTSPIARRSSVGASLLWHRTLLPTYRSISANLYAACAGVQSDYLLSEVFSPAPEYAAYMAGFSVGYSSQFASREPPYAVLGFSCSGRAEYELASATGFGGVSLSGAASVKGRISASLYGSIAPFGGVAFAPGIRFLEYGGNTRISAADIPYPEYSEYRTFLTLSNWYLFGETQAQIFNIEIGSVLRLPFFASLGLRRITGTMGLRVAGLEVSGSPGMLSSAFAQITADMALLAGLGGATHTRLTLEAAWAFQPGSAGGYPLHLSAGLQASLE